MTPPLLQTVRVPLGDLRLNERNPRIIRDDRFEALKDSLKADPEMMLARPVIALPDGTIIAGNMRYRAAQALGWEDVPVVYTDLDEDRAKTWMFRDNRPYGEDDEDLTAELLYELEQSQRDLLPLTGYNDEEIERLLDMVRGPITIPSDADDVPPPPVEPKSVAGKLYELGPHRLLCADATDPESLRAVVGGREVTVMWTDPPYGVNYVGKTAEALTITNDSPDSLEELLRRAFRACDAVLAPGAYIYIASPAGPQGTTFRLAFEEAGWHFHQALVWVKQTMVLGHSDYHYQHEDVLYGWKRGDGRPGRGGARWYGGNAQTSVFQVDRPMRSTEHPTMKPVLLMDAMLANSARPGEVILDPFAGSGSTLIAAQARGLTCLAVELDPVYCDVIRQRYAEYVGDPSLAP